jgi:hypothetical protein
MPQYLSSLPYIPMIVKNFVLFVVSFTDVEGSGRGLIGNCLCGLRETTEEIVYVVFWPRFETDIYPVQV